MRVALLIEEQQIVRAGLRLLLEQDGRYRVEEAADEVEAWSRLRAGKFALAIVGGLTSDENPVGLVGRIRHEHAGMPILMLSGSGEPAVVWAAVRAGVTGYMTKNGTHEEFLALTRSLQYGGLHLDSRVGPPFVAELLSHKQDRPTALQQRRDFLLSALDKGLSNREMADRLNLSVSSVKACMRGLFVDYGVKDRVGLLVVVKQGNLDCPPG